VLGGLRVVLIKDQIGIFHATLAQLFFVCTCAIALFTSKGWVEFNVGQASRLPNRAKRGDGKEEPISDVRRSGETPALLSTRRWFIATTVLIFLQLVLGATMRHQHAGLAISDFPLAYGRLWPATGAASVAHYNEMRPATNSLNPITAFQIKLQMAHRIVAVLILVGVALCVRFALRHFRRRSPLTKLAFLWLGLIVAQICLGAATVLSNKAADVATAHVLLGALSLATGATLCIISSRSLEPVRTGALPSAGRPAPDSSALAAGTATAQ
jgi:cytochrome c oxidase assembly protein subunit 15